MCVWGDGPKRAKVMIVGEAPGEAEAKTGKPFQGKSGKLLRAELEAAGIRDFYITNAVKCRPPDNRTPKGKEEKACKVYIEEELATVRPEYVLTLGNPATKAIFNRTKITEIHGQLLERNGVKGVPAYHPAYVLRDPTKLPQFQTDLRRFADLIAGRERKSTVKYRVVTRENLDEFFEEFRRTLWFSFDVETSSLDWFRPGEWINTLSIGVEVTDTSWVIPLHLKSEDGEYTSPFYDREDAQPILLKLQTMAREMKKRGVGHNGKFDNLWLMKHYDVCFPLVFDTMLAHHTIDENSNHDLKGLVRQYLKEPDYDIDGKNKTRPKNRAEVKSLFEYNGKDTTYTLRLKKIFHEELAKDPLLLRLFRRLVMRAARALQKIEFNGLFINLELFEKVKKNVKRELEELKAKLDEMAEEAAGKPINFNAPHQVAELFFEHLELPIIHKTGTGAPSTAEATLVELKDQHPIVEMLVKYRELEKFYGTYLGKEDKKGKEKGWTQFMVGPIMYMSYKIHGTVTGRYSSRIHQTPRDGTIRNVVDAPDGWTFVQGDFSQAELRVVAHMSMDPELVTCYRKSIDVHWRTLMHLLLSGASGDYIEPALETASALAGKPIKSLPVAVEWLMEAGPDKCVEIWKGWKEGRKKTKGVNFGYVYGMGWFKFIEYAKTKYGFTPTENESKQTRSSFFRLYSKLEPWHRRQRKLVHLDGFVRNPAGRKRRLPGVWGDDKKVIKESERQAINAPVQGFIGDFKAMALVELVEKLDPKRARVVGEVHDSVLFWVRTKHLKTELPRIARIMRKPELLEEFNIRLNVPMEVDLEVGPWGKGKKWVEEAA